MDSSTRVDGRLRRTPRIPRAWLFFPRSEHAGLRQLECENHPKYIFKVVRFLNMKVNTYFVTDKRGPSDARVQSKTRAWPNLNDLEPTAGPACQNCKALEHRMRSWAADGTDKHTQSLRRRKHGRQVGACRLSRQTYGVSGNAPGTTDASTQQFAWICEPSLWKPKCFLYSKSNHTAEHLGTITVAPDFASVVTRLNGRIIDLSVHLHTTSLAQVEIRSLN
jgi:hypothetical protein